MSKNKKLVIILLIVAALIAVIPFFALRGAAFGGSDDAGSQVVEEIYPEYESWATPVLENAIGGELPGEIESLLCRPASAWASSPSLSAVSTKEKNWEKPTRNFKNFKLRK